MIVLANMGGIAPKVTPELLPDQLAQTAQNVILHNGGVAPLRAPSTVATPTKAGTKKSIYRFGVSQPESQYWFSWTTLVNVARGPIPGDTTERTYFTGDGTPKKTDMTLALSSGTSYPVASFELGVPAPTTAPVAVQEAGTGPTVTEQRAYVFTNVTAWGEESAPSPAVVATADATHVVRLNNIEAVPGGAYNITKRYIYRTVSSASGTNYYWIGEIASGVTTFLDNVSITAIGEPLPSLDWDVPPDDLQGLVALPSGAHCGFSGKDVCFSVINAPYAYPQKYRLTCDYDVVAVAPMGQGVAVLTKGYPYFINTGEPESAQMIRLNEEQACISAKSVVPFMGGVIYASPDGLVNMSQSGVTLLTDKLYDRKTWQAINPSSIFACKHDGRYYGFLDTGGFILDLAGNFTTHDITATACYVDPVLDQLYLAIGTNIQKWDAGSLKTHTYKSKRHNLANLTSFSCGQIKSNSFDNLTLKVIATMDNASDATAIANASGGALVANGKLLTHTRSVTSPAPFRLPSGFSARMYEIEISGTDHWTVCMIAGSVEELKNG